jgi:hypothetical protein
MVGRMSEPHYAVIEGRQWFISERVLAALAEDPSWTGWAEMPPEAKGPDGPATLFHSVSGSVFTTRRDVKAALSSDATAGVPSAVIDTLIEASFDCRASAIVPNDPAVVLYRTDNGGKLHLPECPHVRAVDIIEVSAEERQQMEVCMGWCNSELIGFGRSYFTTIEDALEDMGTPQHARPEITRLLNEVRWEGVFTPNSRSYVAVTQGGRGVAWAGKTYVSYLDGRTVYLPDYEWAEGGGGAKQELLRGDVCPIHFYERSVTGACPGCD